MTRAERDLLGQLAHDLATAMTPMIGWAELALQNPDCAKACGRDLLEVARAAERCGAELDKLRTALRNVEVTG